MSSISERRAIAAGLLLFIATACSSGGGGSVLSDAGTSAQGTSGTGVKAASIAEREEACKRMNTGRDADCSQTIDSCIAQNGNIGYTNAYLSALADCFADAPCAKYGRCVEQALEAVDANYKTASDVVACKDKILSCPLPKGPGQYGTNDQCEWLVAVSSDLRTRRAKCVEQSCDKFATCLWSF